MKNLDSDTILGDPPALKKADSCWKLKAVFPDTMT